MTELRLPLKKKWFDITKAGMKTEDYREVNNYWYSRICLYDGKTQTQKFWEYVPLNTLTFNPDKVSFKQFDTNTMTLGYPKATDTDRTLKLEHKGIEIRTGNPEWGAEPGKLYFVIMHGKIIETP